MAGRGRGRESTLPAWMTVAGAAPAAPAPAAATVASKRAAPETFADAEEPSQKAAKTETPAAAAVSAALAATLPAAASAPAAAPQPAAAPAAAPASAPADKPADEAEGEEPLPEPKTPEEKEVRELLIEAGKVEYSHGPPGDNVKVTESRAVMEGSVTMCNWRQNSLKARGRKTLSPTTTIAEYLGSTGEVLGYDRTTVTVKVKMARDGRDLMIPAEAVGFYGDKWLDKLEQDDKPQETPAAAATAAGAAAAAPGQVVPGATVRPSVLGPRAPHSVR